MHVIFYILSLVQPMMMATRVTSLYQVQAQRIPLFNKIGVYQNNQRYDSELFIHE
jgi:hypothetical protein